MIWLAQQFAIRRLLCQLFVAKKVLQFGCSVGTTLL